jgi:extracellular matrix regulatory protein A
MTYTLLNIGHGSSVVANNIIAILSPNSAPMRRLRDDAKDENRLLDATHGRKTRSIIFLKDNYIVLSASQPETIAQRYEALKEKQEKQDPQNQNP